MKLAALTTAAALLVAPAVSAADLGGGMSAGATVEGTYTTGTDVFALTVDPYVGMTLFGVNNKLTANVDLLGLESGSAIDTFQGLDWKSSIAMGMDGMEVFGKISSDADLKWGDMTIGLSFAF